MNDTSNGVELVAQWRDQGNQNNPAGPLFAASEFAKLISLAQFPVCGIACQLLRAHPDNDLPSILIPYGEELKNYDQFKQH